MTPDQYALIQPYLKHIELEYCSGDSCNTLANLHESFGWGHINRGCSGCISEMIRRFKDFKNEYESKL